MTCDGIAGSVEKEYGTSSPDPDSSDSASDSDSELEPFSFFGLVSVVVAVGVVLAASEEFVVEFVSEFGVPAVVSGGRSIKLMGIPNFLFRASSPKNNVDKKLHVEIIDNSV